MASSFPAPAPCSGQPAWLDKLRRSAYQRFAELGFPTAALEDWRFTSVAPIARASFQPSGNGRPAALAALAPGVRVL